MSRYFFLIATLAIFAGTALPAVAAPRHGGELVFLAIAGSPRHFNPAIISGSATAMVGTQIFASPLRYDENWNPLPYLAESWQTSEDGLSVTLKLVKGATFHDGHPITAEDVAFSIMTVKKYHPFKSMFAPVERVDTPDPQTVVIQLVRPHPAILLAMTPALLPILPKHIYGDGQDLKTHPANLKPVGSGPFRFVKYEPGKFIVLKKNEQFFIPGRPYLDKLIFRIESDPKAQMIAMERQEAHLLPLFLKPEGLDRLGKVSHLAVTSKGYEGIGSINWLAFNLLRKPLDDKRVRQAIAYAIDAEFITKYLHKGYSRPGTGPIIPDSPFYEPNVTTYDIDLGKAKKLLDEAGYPLKSDGTRFSLTLDHFSVIPSQHRDVALYIKRQLSKIGINVHVRKPKNMGEWIKRIGNWDFDMTMDCPYNWGDPAIGVHRTYLSNNIRKGVVWSNTQNYRNSRVDELLEKAATEMDVEKRKALYSEFQKIVTEEVPVVWINILPFHTIYNKGLGNPPVSIWGVHSPLDEVYWEKPPVIKYVSTPDLEADSDSLKRVGVRAIDLLKERGLYPALKIFKAPGQGFLDLKGPGLHIIGFTRKGIVFLDNSGQTKPGVNIGKILDLEGNRFLPRFVDAAEGKNGGYVETIGVWPHPETHRAGPMSGWCGMLTRDDIICVLKWDNEKGDGK
jgi:peptide/nickel transport system substrate-binding protein